MFFSFVCRLLPGAPRLGPDKVRQAQKMAAIATRIMSIFMR